jgi:CheY-like chemotaxis protein
MKKILFIDDEKDLIPVIHQLFPKEKYRIISAGDGAEALLKCRNEVFDLIITDYRMPKMDGLKFYKSYREIEVSNKQPSIPILFVSGFVDEIRSKRMSWERCDFLNKPFQMYEIVQKVEKLLGIQKTNDSASMEAKILLAKGDTLFEEGDTGGAMYFLVSGLLVAFKQNAKGEKIKVGNIYPGEVVGEQSVIDGSARCLSINALESSELLIIPEAKVAEILEGQPKWMQVMVQNMTKRLKDALKQIS